MLRKSHRLLKKTNAVKNIFKICKAYIKDLPLYNINYFNKKSKNI